MNIPWLNNTKGEPSTSLTFATIGFVVVIGWLLAYILAVPLGLTIAAFNASEAMLVLTPLLGLYFGRRYTDSTTPAPTPEDESSDAPPPAPRRR